MTQKQSVSQVIPSKEGLVPGWHWLVARGKILTIHPLGGAHSKPFLPRTAIRNTVDATRHGVCGDARRRSLPTVRQPVPATLPCLAMRTKTLCGVDQARPRARRTALRCAAHDIPGARRCRVPAALPGLAMRTTTLCGVDKAIVHAALPRCPPIRHAIPMSSDTAAAAPCPCPPHC